MSISPSVLRAHIENAAAPVGRLWPLQTFNSANPLAGFEDQPFDRAVASAQALLGGRGYPRPTVFRAAYERGAIDPSILASHAAAHGLSLAPHEMLDRMEVQEQEEATRPFDTATERLNQALAKWLAAFLDQGQAVWPMPHRSDGFYAAWRAVAPYDGTLLDLPAALPETPWEALSEALDGHPKETWEAIFTHHLAALPGWSGFVKWRAQRSDHDWQDAHPITLADLLAVRLTMAPGFGASVRPESLTHTEPADPTDTPPLAALWLRAWEDTARRSMLRRIRTPAQRPVANESSGDTGNDALKRPDAQLVFCIDVRSEVIRRHVERVGPYETHGYAGFFGIPMQHDGYGSDTPVKACPPIVDPKHRVADRPACAHDAERFDRWTRALNAGTTFLKSLKNDVAAAFGFVEGSGGFFGGALAARTLVPSGLRWIRDAIGLPTPDDFCMPTVDHPAASDDEATASPLPLGLSHEAQVLYAETAFRLMGWTDRFAPIVVFTGHGSETPNNPYKASLDCGACAGNPGGPNARVLAAICNKAAVRDALQERGISIPDDTVFLAGEHNTTTDAIRLFVNDATPPVPSDALNRLRQDLDAAREGATAERVHGMNTPPTVSGRTDTARRASDWAETRPEWGLSGNMGFIIGSRELTKGRSLDGRCFLHSYDWRADDDGTALETIMSGPLVVGEWINTQYYFSTVDNAVYGSGSKVTQNVVGTFGIVQGNGGDLMTGLPLQSLHRTDSELHHQPLRLMAVIHAPRERVDRIVRRQSRLRQLFDHEWMTLVVMDPTADDTCFRYRPGGTWERWLADESTYRVRQYAEHTGSESAGHGKVRQVRTS